MQPRDPPSGDAATPENALLTPALQGPRRCSRDFDRCSHPSIRSTEGPCPKSSTHKSRAAERADELLEAGDIEGAAIWRAIMDAIEELQRGPEPGEMVN